MQRIKHFFTRLVERFLESIKRFLLSNIFLAFISAILVICIIIDDFADEYMYLVIAGILGGLTSFLLTLINEKYNINKGNIINIAVSLVTAIITYLVFHFFTDNNYIFLAYCGIITAELAISFYLLYFIEDNKKLFAKMVSGLLYCYAMVTTIVLGLCLSLLAFQHLIYDFHNFDKLYWITITICEVFVAPSLFLSYIPTLDEKLQISKAYESILHKAALILYYLLIGILYLYLAKVLITFEMPINRINWFASIGLLFYCLFYLSCQYHKDGLALFHVKYGGFVMIPILLMQSYALFLRINAFGLTTPRYLSVMCNLVALAFVVSSFFKKGPKHVFLFVAFIALIITIGPLNMIDVPFNSQMARIENILIKNGMLQDNKVIANSNISDEDKHEIREIYNYLKFSSSDKENYITEITENEFETVFGFDKYNREDYDKEYHYCNYYLFDESIDIFQYKSMEHLRNNDSLEIAGYNIEDYFWSLYNTYGNWANIELVYIVDDKTKIVFDYIGFTVIDKKEFSGINYSCYILRK